MPCTEELHTAIQKRHGTDYWQKNKQNAACHRKPDSGHSAAAHQEANVPKETE